MKLGIMSFSSTLCSSLWLCSILSGILFSSTVSLYSLRMWVQVSHPHKTIRIIVLYVITYRYLCRRWEVHIVFIFF
jgi:hypothetical protein